MRRKELRLVVTFHTTADAMAMERCCRDAGIAGRLIPVPRELSAGCGLAWSSAPEDRDAVRAAMDRAGIEEEAMHDCMA